VKFVWQGFDWTSTPQISSCNKIKARQAHHARTKPGTSLVMRHFYTGGYISLIE